MKNIFSFVLVMLLFIGLTVQSAEAQKVNRGFASTVDTLQGADNITFTPTSVITKYSGQVAFSFTMTNSVDSCSSVIMQGSDNGTNWSTVSSLTLTDVTYGRLYDQNPDYLRYRLYMSTASGDTVIVTAVNFVYKEE